MNVCLMFGGDGEEAEVSLITADYLKYQLDKIPNINVRTLFIRRDGVRLNESGQPSELRKAGLLVDQSGEWKIDYFIPSFHGYPGETGDIQSLYQMMGIPYLGSGSETSRICFNKILLKLWLENLGLNVAPFIYLNRRASIDMSKIEKFFRDQGNDVYVKASNQGSSFGCFHVQDYSLLKESIESAFNFSPYVLIEKTIKGRELEVAAYHYKDKWMVTNPGEIICPNGFYDNSEKYSDSSQTEIVTVAKNIPKSVIEEMKTKVKYVLNSLEFDDLARFDFFLTSENEIHLNEINTFPGMTKISLFPLLLESNGTQFHDWLKDRILKQKK